MGIGGISVWQLLIVLVIVLLLFGTKRLRSLGGDLGGAIKGFKKAVKDDDAEQKGAADEQRAGLDNSSTESDPTQSRMEEDSKQKSDSPQ